MNQPKDNSKTPGRNHPIKKHKHAEDVKQNPKSNSGEYKNKNIIQTGGFKKDGNGPPFNHQTQQRDWNHTGEKIRMKNIKNNNNGRA